MMLVTYAEANAYDCVMRFSDGDSKKAAVSRQSGSRRRKSGHSLFPKTA